MDTGSPIAPLLWAQPVLVHQEYSSFAASQNNCGVSSVASAAPAGSFTSKYMELLVKHPPVKKIMFHTKKIIFKHLIPFGSDVQNYS